MNKLGVLVASGIAAGSMLVASPAAFASNHHYRHADYHRDRHFTVGVRVVDAASDDRGRRGVSRGDRWSLAFDLVDYRNRVGSGVADCVVTKAPNRNWRDSRSQCDIAFHLPDGDLRMSGSFDGDDFDDGHATFPVRGGTGEFRGADGKTVFRPDDGWRHSGRGRERNLTAEVDLH
ncbi:MAG TPA: hypothetical protein VHL53_17405 [Acidimicrobiia bacterium]|nr:hypothetical protein [Acidimicrobiia bacterium]